MKYILVELWDHSVTQTDNEELAKQYGDSVNFLVINTATGEVRNDGLVMKVPVEKG